MKTLTKSMLLACALLGWFVLPAGAALNVYLELTLNGIAIEGEPATVSVGGVDVSTHIECFAAEHEMFKSSSGGVGSRIQHGPFKITKAVDKASPLLAQGLALNQTGSAKFRFFRNDPDTGETVHYYTVELKNVQIASIRTWSPSTKDPAALSLPYLEEIQFTYTEITIRHEVASTETVIDLTTSN